MLHQELGPCVQALTLIFVPLRFRTHSASIRNNRFDTETIATPVSASETGVSASETTASETTVSDAETAVFRTFVPVKGALSYMKPVLVQANSVK